MITSANRAWTAALWYTIKSISRELSFKELVLSFVVEPIGISAFFHSRNSMKLEYSKFNHSWEQVYEQTFLP